MISNNDILIGGKFNIESNFAIAGSVTANQVQQGKKLVVMYDKNLEYVGDNNQISTGLIDALENIISEVAALNSVFNYTFDFNFAIDFSNPLDKTTPFIVRVYFSF